MKFTIAVITIFAAIIATQANPISVSGNNVGDIVTVGVNANAVLSNNIDVNVITVLLALLNQQLAVINPQPAGVEPAITDFSSLITPEVVSQVKDFKITPEMIEKVKDIKITPEMIDGIKKLLKKE